MKRLYYVFFATIIIFLISGCSNPKNDTGIKLPYTESAFLLGTFIEITTYDKANLELNKKAFERIKDIELKMTINSNTTSEIMALNNFSGKNAVKLSSDTFYVLSKGKYYSDISNGQFDITIGPLVKLWNIGTKQAIKPIQNLIDEKMKLVDYNMLELLDNNTAKLLNENMIVDLGAIAKGYAADEIKKILVDGGTNSALINVGGNVMTIGTKINGEAWKIGIQNPFSNRGDYVGVVQLKDETLVSSGDYEKYFEQDGIRYHHIINPNKGYPCNNELTSVSIITKQSIDGDALSTTAFLMGLTDGISFIDDIQDTEAIFITKDKKIYLTSGIEEKFTLSDKSFVISENNI